jgi:acyl carrier protein
MSPVKITVDEVSGFVAAQLGKRRPAGARFDADTSMEAVGLSSLDVTEIYFEIEERVGLELDPAAASDVKTIGDLVSVVNGLVAKHDGGALTTAAKTSG